MSAPDATKRLSDRLASISATISQAAAVVTIIAEYIESRSGPTDIASVSAAYGAETILQIAINDLGEIELEQRRAHN